MTANTQPVSAATPVAGVEIPSSRGPRHDEILTAPALALYATLERSFRARRRELLATREEVQLPLDRGWRPDFLPETRHVRNATWRVAPVPADLEDRRVEITGPCERKMIINALNSGAQMFMADLEDSNAPTWAN